MADELADMFDVPPEDPMAKQRTITEEFLAIVEDFGEYIEKFMFEIVTFLAVVDSSMGLMKDVLGLFGFEGWRMAFFPTFSFIVTTSVFLFGTKKRKTKRETEAAGGLGQALEMFEDVMDVMDDVVEELDEGDENGGGGPEGECVGNGGDAEGELDDNAPVNENKVKIRKILGVVMLVGGIVAKLRKKDKEADAPENETGEVQNQAPNALDCTNSANALEAANSPVSSLGKPAIETGGRVGLPALNTCTATTNLTTNNATLVCVNVQRTSREINEVAAVARREAAGSTQEVWRNSLNAARDVEQGVIVLKDSTQRETLEAGKVVGQDASLKPGTSNMAGNMAQGTAELAGSLTAGAGKAAAQGTQKSGGLIPLVVRMVRIVVRLANRGKGKEPKTEDDAESSTKDSNNQEGSGEVKGQRTSGIENIRGSSTSLNYDRESIYYDCESQQASPPRTVPRKPIVSAGTQTDGDNSWSVLSPWQSQVRLQELESRVFELEAGRDKTRSSQVNLGDISNMSNRVGEESKRLTRTETPGALKSDKRTSRSQGFKSSISEGRSESLSNVNVQSSRLQHQWQFPSASGLVDNEFSRSRSVQCSSRNDRFNVDSPVIVHHEIAEAAPYGTEFSSYVTHEDFTGRRTGRRDCNVSQARFSNEAETNVSSVEDLEAGHSFTERSALSLSSVRFIDEVPRNETDAKDLSYRQGRQNDTLKTKRRDSKRSRAKEKNQFYLQPSHDALESRSRLSGNQFVPNNRRWNSGKWTSDVCLTGPRHSSKSKFASEDQMTRERYLSEWNLRRKSGVLSRQPTQSSRMTRSPSTLHRSQSSCFGDDESF